MDSYNGLLKSNPHSSVTEAYLQSNSTCFPHVSCLIITMPSLAPLLNVITDACGVKDAVCVQVV